MPYIYKHRRQPTSWKQYRRRAHHKYLRPLFAIEWGAEWAAYLLGRSSLLEVLEYAGSISIVVGVIFYFADAKNRMEQKHYQAWQVINTAHGKGGSGGRIDAMQDLNADRVPLVGVDVSDAFLQGLNLPDADLHRCNMSSADIRNGSFTGSSMEDAVMVFTNLRGGDLGYTHLTGADFTDADLSGVDLRYADVSQVKFDRADLRGANLAGLVNWRAIRSMVATNILGVRNAPDGFVAWAKMEGAVESTTP
jgi:Pentapeptide repeats (8 copies)